MQDSAVARNVAPPLKNFPRTSRLGALQQSVWASHPHCCRIVQDKIQSKTMRTRVGNITLLFLITSHISSFCAQIANYLGTCLVTSW